MLAFQNCCTKETDLQCYTGRVFHDILVSAQWGNLYSVWNPLYLFPLKLVKLTHNIVTGIKEILAVGRDLGTKLKVGIHMQNHSTKNLYKTNKSCFQVE